MFRALRQVGQAVCLSSVISTAVLTFVYPLKAKYPTSLASWHLRRISGYAPEGPPAFVFDIDGVLIQGGTVLPEAKKALAKLYTNNGVSASLLHNIYSISSAHRMPSPSKACRQQPCNVGACIWNTQSVEHVGCMDVQAAADNSCLL